ncbi:WD40 repeat-like protein, partial [Aureobasidium melanogenum]|uniref:WD40 repeat-like protein n=1 Tax=Aureobasidium melanogenum (strain CBS 110374) TaxID=1043003 RepID=A0A074VVR6_AURM1
MHRAVKQAATASKPASQPTFKLPKNSHLIITTSGGIFSWDRDGVKQLFSSSKKGILAAREAKDGSQVLAVADEHVVVLHDCKRGREESWGLSGSEGIVRLLEYAPDAKSLFLSTSLTGAIQHYSIHESRYLDPPSNHPSPPTVLAISSTSHLMLSASENPSVVYLQNLALKTSAIQLHPSASGAAVATAAFHPERPNIFLLAFKDGTIAAYDATRITRTSEACTSTKSRSVNNGHAGEISHLSNLHRVTNIRNLSDPPDASPNTTIGSRTMAITGAAFLPGFRSRAVSAGADGRCRLVDFEAGGKILRTWHAQAPVTSLSVLAIKSSSKTEKTVSKQKPGVTISGTEAKTVIAVGRVDGQVLLFDSVGLRLDQVRVNALGEKVINVEWMDGPSPYAISSPIKPVSSKIDAKFDLSHSTPGKGQRTQAGLPDALRLPPGAVFIPTQPAPAIAVIGCEAEQVSTVRHTPAANMVRRSPAVETTYLDLFSPVKKVSPPRQQQKSPVSSPHRRRKRLSSQTFVRSNSPESAHIAVEVVTRSPETPKHLSIHPLNTTIERQQKPPHGTTPASARRGPRSGRKKAHGRSAQGLNRSPSASMGAGRNGKVLADLRRLGVEQPAKKNGKAALFAPYMNHTGISNLPRTEAQTTANNVVLLTEPLPIEECSPESQHHHPNQPPQVHFELESRSSDRDIWMSAGSSEDECNQRQDDERTHYHARQRRMTQSQSQRSEPETTLEAATVSPQPHNAAKEAAVLSMSEEAMFSAVSHISNIDGEFMPASSDVQRLFPRGSSIYSTSPSRQSPKKSPRRQVQVWNDEAPKTKTVINPMQREKLVSMQSNTTLKATPRDMAAKKAAAVPLGSGETKRTKALPPIPSLPSTIVPSQPQRCACAEKSCPGCLELGARVHSLEDEVARLKIEVLGLRSALRKTGVSSRVAERKR